MKGQSSGPALSVVFVDYDNIYLSLKRKNEEAARRFAKDAGGWFRGIETGRLITPTQGVSLAGPRRIAINRCYGNPAPRRNPSDNSTDMNSFPFVRHHFLRAGFEVVDCPPLTAQLKNSADIKMVMDVLDYIDHATHFDEFIMLSGDADFTPVLHRLRAHARRTVVYANDHTATPYTAISDGEVREADLIALLMDGRVTNEAGATPAVEASSRPQAAQLEQLATSIMTEVANVVRAAGQPVPLEALADRAVRVLGHERTVGSNWAGTGSFRELVARRMPQGLRMSDTPPYYLFDASRQITGGQAPAREPRRIEAREPQQRGGPAEARPSSAHSGYAPVAPAARPSAPAAQARPTTPAAPAATRSAESPAAIQQSIARIHEASQAPPLSPPDYRALFEAMAEEISVNGLAGAQTLGNIQQRALHYGADIHPDYIRMVMEVVCEADPRFEQGVSAVLFAHRFRNYVLTQCKRAGMAPSATEMDLIEMWFMGSNLESAAASGPRPASAPAAAKPRVPTASTIPQADPRGDRWWHLNDAPQGAQDQVPDPASDEDLPRIMRTRLRI